MPGTLEREATEFVPGQPSPSRLQPPPAGRCMIPRARLLRRLAGSGGSSVMMVTAPAGYGKTTLLAQWAEADPRPVAWLQLERNDDDAVRLTRDVAFALSRVGRVDPSIFDALRGDAGALAPVSLPRLAVAMKEMRPFVLVLDDAHVLRTARTQDLLQSVIEHLPEHSLLVISARSQPAIPLARLRASGLLDEIDSRELAMTKGESLQLLAAAVPGISPVLAATVAERCEGWAAALYLASIALRHDRDDSRYGADLTIADYLNEEVLARASEDDRSFLTRSSILRTLSGSLCDAVLERDDSSARLRRLADQNLLVRPLDHCGERYKIHGLFKETLRANLEHSRELPALHARAAQWFARHGDFAEAITHASLAGETDLAAEYTWRMTPEWLSEGRSGELAGIVAGFSASARVEHPELDAILAFCAINVGDGEAALLHVERAARSEPRVLGDGTPLAGVVELLQAVIGRDGARHMGQAATRALELLPPQSVFGTIPMYLEGAARHITGERDAAAEQLAAAERFATDSSPTMQTLCGAQLALIDIERGDWPAAAHRLRRARAVQRVHGFEEYTTQHIVFAVSALVAAEDGDARVARSEASRAHRFVSSQHHLSPWLVAQTLITLARTEAALGDAGAARQLLKRAKALVLLVPDAPALRTYFDEACAGVKALEAEPQQDQPGLTTAEMRVLQQLPSYHPLREIADELGVSLNTVKSQAGAIYRKLDVSSRSDAVVEAQRLGLLARER